eukprot:10371461-Alexandrium_andersonii.AAC.1
MSASLVGSEMCIRDSSRQLRRMGFQCHVLHRSRVHAPSIGGGGGACSACLLYTSDAADDM